MDLELIHKQHIDPLRIFTNEKQASVVGIYRKKRIFEFQVEDLISIEE